MKSKEFEKATIFSLAGSIDYSNDAIVSRTIINRPEGTITLFAFDKGQGLSEHTTAYDAQVQVIDGTAKILIDKEPFVLNKDDLIIMPANVPHALEAISKFRMILTMIKSKS